MAVVIPFAPKRRQQARSCSLPLRMAEILFFTGVRYERFAEARPHEGRAPVRRPRKPAPRRTTTRKAARGQPA